MKFPPIPLDVIGAFWPAARAGRRLPGRLTFDPGNGGRLEVVGSFHDPKEVIAKAGRQADGSVSVGLSELLGLDSPAIRVIGDTAAGPVTLEQCLGGQGTYHVPLVLSGAHIPDGEPLRFQTAAFYIHHLVFWTGISGFSGSLDYRADAHRPEEVHISYRPVPETSVDMPRGRLVLRFPYRLRYDRVPESPVEETSALELEFAEPGSIVDVIQAHHALQVLMSIAVAAPVRVTETLVQPPGGNQLQVHAQGVGAGSYAGNGRAVRRADMLFTYTDLGELSGIGRWLTISEKFWPAISALATRWYTPELYHDLQFFNMATAAEAFARIRQDEQSVKFEQALKALAGLAGAPFQSMIGGVDDWAKRVVRTRNDHIVHYGLRGDPDSEFLYWLTGSLYVLVVLCLLRECEVPEENLPNPRSSPWMATIARKLCGNRSDGPR